MGGSLLVDGCSGCRKSPDPPCVPWRRLFVQTLRKSARVLETCLANHIFCEIFKDKLFLRLLSSPHLGTNVRAYKPQTEAKMSSRCPC